MSANGPWDQLVRLQNIELMPLSDGTSIKLGKSHGNALLVPHRDEYSETVGIASTVRKKSAVFIPDIDKWDMWSSTFAMLCRSVDYALLDATFF